MMMITKKEVMKLLDYDESTGVFTWKVSNRKRVKVGTEAGTVMVTNAGKSYRRIKINGKIYYAHRLSWLILYGEFPEDQIDHIDGNGLNNRADNLRSVSHADNGKNQRKCRTNTSGVMGVTWHRAKWMVRMVINGRRTFIGYFKSFDEAMKVRKAAEKTYNYHPNHGSERPL